MRGLKTLVFVCVLTLLLATPAMAKKMRFGVPPWPGVTVKSEVVIQILETIGYPATDLQIGPPIIYNGFKSGEVDAFLGAWLPQQHSMLDPLLEAGTVAIAQTNLAEAEIGLCVPAYVYDAGVKSFTDLAPNAEKFGKTVYDIEPGSGMHTAMEAMIKENKVGLGGWQHMGTSTPVMLQEVLQKVEKKEWIAFGCWKPHWMNLLMDMRYLKVAPGAEGYASKSTVETVVSADLEKKRPNVYRFLSQLVVPSKEQSKWIMDFGKKDIPAPKVAKAWIGANHEIVAKWLDGVKAADGSDAMALVKKAFPAS